MKKNLLLKFLLLNMLISGACLTAQIPNYIPQNGLVAWYPFNGNANDESGNGNNGVMNNVSLEQNRNGNSNKAVGFWNSNSNITIQSITEPGIIQYSVAGWFKKSTESVNQEGSIFCGSNPCNGPGGLRFHIGSTNQVAFGAEFQNCSSVWSYSQNQNYADNIWHSFAVVFNSQPGQITYNQFLIYIDGTLIQRVPYYQGNTSVVIAPINNNGIATILGNAFGGGDHFKGILDDIGIWNRALSSQEIASLYSGQIPCQNTSSAISASITQGESYSFNGQNITSAGTYLDTLQNASGCDSLVTLNLVVEPFVEPLNCEINATNYSVCPNTNVTLSVPSNQLGTQTNSFGQEINGYTYKGSFNGHAYYMANTPGTWTLASQNAINAGGHLTTINSLEEQQFIASLTLENLWIGFKRNTNTNQWEWITGEPVTYLNWRNGEPNGIGENGERFAHMLTDNCFGPNQWNDLNDIDWNGTCYSNCYGILELESMNDSHILWSTGETTPSISVSPTETTTYSVTVTQGNQTCTSEVTITVNQPSTSTINASITEGETYSFNGQNITNAGTYTSTLQNAAGCDSVITLNLTVLPVPVAGCYASSVISFNQGLNVLGSAIPAIRSNSNQAIGQPEAVVTNVVNFVSLGFGGTITVAFDAPIANGAGNDIHLDEATWGNNPCNRYPEKADVFASQDGTNFIYLGQACQDASFDLGVMSWAKYIRLVDVSDILSFNSDADGYDLNGIECLNGSATNPTNDGLQACTLQEIVSYSPGNRKNGTAVPSPRNNANNALGEPQGNNTINFVALGFGGSLVAKFDYVVFNQPGNDLRITETSFGNPSCNNYPEKARVSVSMDNLNWTELGELCQDGEVDLSFVNYAQYIKVQDSSPLSSTKFNGAADGFDIDAIVVLNNGCSSSAARLSNEDNTSTPDASMSISAFPNPMEEYTILNFEGLENDSFFTFQIMDAAGRLINNQTIRVLMSNPTYLYNGADLASGIYQIVITGENGSQVIRLVK